MKRLCLLLTACAVLAACDQKEEPRTASSATAEQVTPAQTAPQPSEVLTQEPTEMPGEQPEAAAPSQADILPPECDEYLARAMACAAKSSDPVAKTYARNIELSQAQWRTAADKERLAAGCRAANEQFGEVIATFKCE